MFCELKDDGSKQFLATVNQLQISNRNHFSSKLVVVLHAGFGFGPFIDAMRGRAVLLARHQ